MPTYNFHYAIRRRRDIDGHKPATKIFTAAYCNSNVLIQESEVEAISHLGDDYPYILKGGVDENKIIHLLNKAKSEYGSREWERGLAVMKKIRNNITEENIARQFMSVLEDIQ